MPKNECTSWPSTKSDEPLTGPLLVCTTNLSITPCTWQAVIQSHTTHSFHIFTRFSDFICILQSIKTLGFFLNFQNLQEIFRNQLLKTNFFDSTTFTVELPEPARIFLSFIFGINFHSIFTAWKLAQVRFVVIQIDFFLFFIHIWHFQFFMTFIFHTGSHLTISHLITGKKIETMDQNSINYLCRLTLL